jgi:adsorption protein B
MTTAAILSGMAGELALFAAAGYLLFAADDVLVDLIYFSRRLWRAATIYSRFPRAFAHQLAPPDEPGWIAIFVPAWDEAPVIAPMLRATLDRVAHDDYRIFVGHYRNDPATAAAIASVNDARVIPVALAIDGPTTKADCLNHLYAALIDAEAADGRAAKAVVLHDAEDVVHPYELTLFDRLIERAGLVQLPVLPLVDPNSRWISGHYCDEFAESHAKELVVREAVGASIPLAGVGCAVSRQSLSQLAGLHAGRPFAGTSMTEDYELGLRLGALGARTMFVRLPALPGSRAMVSSRGHFPSSLDDAVRQKARWLGGIAFAGWDRLGWRGGLGERWMRMRDRRGPLAALLMFAGYIAAFLWGQMWLASMLGAPRPSPPSPALFTLLGINAALLGWRVLMRVGFTTSAYGWRQGLLAIPRLLVGNFIALLAARRAFCVHATGGPRQWDKTRHIFPTELPRG